MGLVTTKDMFQKAYEGGYAIEIGRASCRERVFLRV